MLDRLRTWWTRPCGTRELWAVALPLVVSWASWTVMNFTDRMFLLWYDQAAVAAALPSGMVFWTLICFPLGVVGYATTFVAQYEGAERRERVGPVVGQAVWTAVFATPLLMATIPLAPGFFALAGHEPHLAALESLYFQVAMAGAGGMLISGAQAAYFTGRGKTRVVMVVDSGASLLNIVLDYLWIFGRLGFPEMGLEGAAWATVVSQWAKVLGYAAIMQIGADRRRYNLAAARRFDLRLLGRLWYYGVPSGLQWVLESSGFTAFLLMVGWLGEQATAATTLAFGVNMVAFIPPIGLAIAVTTLVGQQLGGGRPDLAARATWTGFWMAFGYTAFLGVLYVGLPDLFLIGYASGADPREFAALRTTVVVLLWFVAAYCVFDAANLIFSSALRGAGDTQFILIVGALMCPLPALFTWLGIAYWGGGLIWSWSVITVWICALGLIYFLRFLQGRWRTMRVIEPELPPDAAETAVPAASQATSPL